MNRPRARRPQSGTVRSMFRVPWPPFCTMPSPVPMSCSRKSLNGWMILLPSALATLSAPPLMLVPGCGGLHFGNVAAGAADRVEDPATVFGILGVGAGGVAWRNQGRSHEQRKQFHVHAFVVDALRRVGRLLHLDAVVRVLVRLQRAGDAHLVHVGVSGERDEARLLVFPPEASCPGLSRRLQHRHVDELFRGWTTAGSSVCRRSCCC